MTLLTEKRCRTWQTGALIRKLLWTQRKPEKQCTAKSALRVKLLTEFPTLSFWGLKLLFTPTQWWEKHNSTFKFLRKLQKTAEHTLPYACRIPIKVLNLNYRLFAVFTEDSAECTQPGPFLQEFRPLLSSPDGSKHINPIFKMCIQEAHSGCNLHELHFMLCFLTYHNGRHKK